VPTPNLFAPTISCIAAGVCWLSHHRRLSFAPQGGRGTVFLNLIFLLHCHASGDEWTSRRVSAR
jgi:hypothetical protein